MQKSVDNILQQRLGGKVERCHNIPHHGSYSVAAHTWGCAMLLLALWPDRIWLLPRILAHDVAEGWVGDVPAPTCRYVPGVRDNLNKVEGKLLEALGLPDGYEGLSDEETAILKAVDRLEFVIWCYEQVHLGNLYVMEALGEMDRVLTVESPLPEPAMEFYVQLKRRFMTCPTGILPRQAGIVKAISEEIAG